MNDQLRIVERDAFERLARQLIGNVAQGGPDGLGKGKKVTKEYLDGLNVHKWFDIRMADEELQKQIEDVRISLEAKRKEFDEAWNE